MKFTSVASVSAVVGALAITVFLGCSTIYSKNQPFVLTFAEDVGRIKTAGDPQVSFPEFHGMCLKACRNDASPEARCNPAKISSHWTSYLNACTTNKNRCSLTSIGCGGEWREDFLN
mmetsp:Transcript_1216/g.2578  ORF Transcript_1216/g.2578 Transcript_1216/m.2578 type:complete len:117 (-) Transcript_1216:137-487(-)